MSTELNILSLLENMEWPANKLDILRYATDNDFVDDVFETINNIEVEEDYYFSSVNDLIASIGNVLAKEDEGNNLSEETFKEENLGVNGPLE
ncbi:MAG: DUF2795 domain-containing protein [Cytophagales bacterium]|jgi:hypothetical protein|nr:DUF2795 domain-containing protein [Cytophagales bacterium]